MEEKNPINNKARPLTGCFWNGSPRKTQMPLITQADQAPYMQRYFIKTPTCAIDLDSIINVRFPAEIRISRYGSNILQTKGRTPVFQESLEEEEEDYHDAEDENDEAQER